MHYAIHTSRMDAWFNTVKSLLFARVDQDFYGGTCPFKFDFFTEYIGVW